jgi:hypothetical protein
VKYGVITTYAWNFGDSSTATVTTPTTTHTYAGGGTYTATVTETDSAGTSTTQVFTGQTVSRNGGAAAQVSHTVVIALGWVSAPSSIGFSATLNGLDQTVTATLPFDVGDGILTAGWSISATSTLFTNLAATHTLPANATTITTTPSDVCDAGCTVATNSVGYPYTLPAGVSAPTATKFFNAANNTGIGNQTITPTFRLLILASSYAAAYSSTWTFTLASGP